MKRITSLCLSENTLTVLLDSEDTITAYGKVEIRDSQHHLCFEHEIGVSPFPSIPVEFILGEEISTLQKASGLLLVRLGSGYEMSFSRVGIEPEVAVLAIDGEIDVVC